MATASGRHDDLRHEILRDIANPQLYRANAFRVLGLSVTVDSAEMNRQHKKLKLLEKLGEADAQNQPGAMSLTPPPGAEDLRRAGQRLQDMQYRIIDELFWFWPVDHANGVADAAYQAACQGQLRDAHDIWCQQKDPTGVWPPNTQAVAIHNLAVLYHALALDLEYMLTHGNGGEVSGDLKTQARRDRYWAVALEHWADFADNESGWSYVLSRAEALDDPRLTSGFVSRLRRSLPEAILTISISLAVRAARLSDIPEAKRQLLFVRRSRFDPDLATRLLEREASPLVEQVRRICEPIEVRSKASPETADQLAKSVLKECRALLIGLRAILRKEHYLRQDSFDRVASTVRSCMIDYGNATKDWGGCVRMLEYAESLAIDEGLQSRLCDDLTKVKEYHAEERYNEDLKKAVSGDCVYEVSICAGQVRMPDSCACCLQPATHKQPVSYTWEETQGLNRYKRTVSFRFPICDVCQQHQTEYLMKRATLVVLAAGVSIGVGYVLADAVGTLEWLHFVLGGGVLTLVLTLVLSTIIRLRLLPEQHACRARAVEMPEASDLGVVFRFHNPLFADAFAQANGAPFRKRRTSKPTRGSHILAGRGAILLLTAALMIGGIGHSLTYVVKEDDWRGKSSGSTRNYSGPESSAPSSTYMPPRSPTPSRSYTGLSKRIDAGRARVRALEANIAQMDSQLESLSSSIAGYKREIEVSESQARSGRPANQYSYEQALAHHNRLVEQYNAALVRRNAECGEYKQELASVNDMVDRYNRGER